MTGRAGWAAAAKAAAQRIRTSSGRNGAKVDGMYWKERGRPAFCPTHHNSPMDKRWRPNVTVAAIIERDGRFLIIEEETSSGLRLNNPAGHLDPGESLAEACAREALEETAWHFRPTALVGV